MLNEQKLILLKGAFKGYLAAEKGTKTAFKTRDKLSPAAKQLTKTKAYKHWEEAVNYRTYCFNYLMRLLNEICK